MKTLTLTLLFAAALALGCSGSSITGPALDSQDVGELIPAGEKCNPDAFPC